MIVWFALFIPIVITILLPIVFKTRIVWWELLLPVVVSALVISISLAINEAIQTNATEYLTYIATEARYYEAWDEEVDCRHPKYCTRDKTESYSCGKDGRDTCYRTVTEEYQCGYEHLYDVEYHSEYWELYDSGKGSTYITENTFNGYVKYWGNKSFIELNRDYHSKDGDAYSTKWGGSDTNLEAVNRLGSYKNKVAVTNNVFKFENINKDDYLNYGLYSYPEVQGYKLRHILGVDDYSGERKLEVINGRLGFSKQVKVFVLIYKNQSITSSFKQEAFWKGGNKNEFILTIGVDASNTVQWGRAFSWSEKEMAKVKAKYAVEKQLNQKLDLGRILDEIQDIINTEYVRKEFKDFDYIQVELSTITVVLVFSLVFIITLGICYFIVKNDIKYSERHSDTNSYEEGNIKGSNKPIWPPSRLIKERTGLVNRKKK